MDSTFRFEKVSYNQFEKDCKMAFIDISDEEIKEAYDNIKLPKRATFGSAGYDFYFPFKEMNSWNAPMLIPTGIRCCISNKSVLMIYPRSSLGFKYGMFLANTVGIIDSDYYYSENEGHIMIKIGSLRPFSFDKDMRFAQGICLQYLLTDDDDTNATRNGGMGSTGV